MKRFDLQASRTSITVRLALVAMLTVTIAAAMAGCIGEAKRSPSPAPSTPAPTVAATPTPTATLPAPTPQPTPATLEIPVTVQGATNLGSLQFDVSYDPQAVQLQSVKTGSLARNVLLDSNKDTPGRVRIGLVAASGISGDGPVVVLVFSSAVKGPTDLTVQNLVASDVNLHDLVTSASSGKVSASGQSSGPVISFRR